MDDIWNLHGGIVHKSTRGVICHLPTPKEPSVATVAAVTRFLRGR